MTSFAQLAPKHVGDDMDVFEAFMVAFDHIMFQMDRGLTINEIAESFGYRAANLNRLLTVGALRWMLLRIPEIPTVKIARAA